jgi:hypothetical protein
MGLDILGFLATTLLPALVPAAVDGAKSLIGGLTGNKAAQPQTFTDLVEWEKLGLEKLRTLAQLDQPAGNISRWVADLRASARYIAVFVILGGYGVLATIDALYKPVTSGVLEQWAMLAQSAVFFLLGDRVNMALKSGK